MKRVITVDQLSKGYRMVEQGVAKQSFKKLITAPIRNFRSIVSLTNVQKTLSQSIEEKQRQMGDTFWALRDVSFEVKEGEILGIVGKNGAGKSTLLKVLSRITAPTKGRAEIFGRVSSLLEVGTGFHPELTGRENIYMNGALHGMSRQEINKNLEEIVDFSGVESFLDTPIKRYSSGMRVRLGFAVAAFLEPEILIIDEVLAVGDAEFRRKCTGKMSEVSRSGRTVLFVSHNMASVESLCTRCLHIDNGQILGDGTPSDIISDYLKTTSADTDINFEENSISLKAHSNRSERYSGSIKLTKLAINPDHKEEGFALTVGKENRLRIHYESAEELPINQIYISCSIRSHVGEMITLLSSEVSDIALNNLPKKGYLECVLPRFSLRPGEYALDLMAVVKGAKTDLIERVCTVPVMGESFFASGKVPSVKQGNVFFDQFWEVVAT